MKKIAKIPVSYESKMSGEELAKKIDDTIINQSKAENLPEKYRQYFYWNKSNGKYMLRFYHSFRSDMCDTAFQGTIKNGLSGSQLDGIIKKPSGVWAVFWTIIGTAVIIALAFLIALLLSEQPEFGLVPIFILILIPVAFVEINLLMFDKKRLKAVNDYLREFTAAENPDLLDEEIENEKQPG